MSLFQDYRILIKILESWNRDTADSEGISSVLINKYRSCLQWTTFYKDCVRFDYEHKNRFWERERLENLFCIYLSITVHEHETWLYDRSIAGVNQGVCGSAPRNTYSWPSFSSVLTKVRIKISLFRVSETLSRSLGNCICSYKYLKKTFLSAAFS
jgi:hypothetical protein